MLGRRQAISFTGSGITVLPTCSDPTPMLSRERVQKSLTSKKKLRLRELVSSRECLDGVICHRLSPSEASRWRLYFALSSRPTAPALHTSQTSQPEISSKQILPDCQRVSSRIFKMGLRLIGTYCRATTIMIFSPPPSDVSNTTNSVRCGPRTLHISQPEIAS